MPCGAGSSILHKTADPLSDGTEPRILFRNRRANRGSLSIETGSPYQTADPSKPRILLPNELNRGSWIRGSRGSNDTLPEILEEHLASSPGLPEQRSLQTHSMFLETSAK